jgi:hypothetical protein
MSKMVAEKNRINMGIKGYWLTLILSQLIGCYVWQRDYSPESVSMNDVNNDGYEDCIVKKGCGAETIFYGTPSGKYNSLSDLEKENNQIIRSAEEQMRQDFINKYSPLENKVQEK